MPNITTIAALLTLLFTLVVFVWLIIIICRPEGIARVTTPISVVINDQELAAKLVAATTSH